MFQMLRNADFLRFYFLILKLRRETFLLIFRNNNYKMFLKSAEICVILGICVPSPTQNENPIRNVNLSKSSIVVLVFPTNSDR